MRVVIVRRPPPPPPKPPPPPATCGLVATKQRATELGQAAHGDKAIVKKTVRGEWYWGLPV